MEKIEKFWWMMTLLLDYIWSLVSSVFNYITGDGSWLLVFTILIIWLYLHDSAQEKNLNALYDERNIDPDNVAAVYKHQSDNIRDLQLVSIKVTLHGILIVLLIGLYKVW